MAKVAQENQLLKDMSAVLPMAEKVLVFAPHPDDETFGCGGTLRLLREAGAEISIHVITDGALGGDPENMNLPALREEESNAAAAVLELPPPSFWHFPDRGLCYGEPLVQRLLETINAFDADLVFLPAASEIHPDHQTLALAGIEALRLSGREVLVAFYEVSFPLSDVNLLIDISSVKNLKRQAMLCFESQLKEQPYDLRVDGLNSYRAYHLGKNVAAAEAFLVCDIAELKGDLRRFFDGPLSHRKRCGYASSPEDFPLVSLIVRSMDRPTLMETLDSISIQTYSNIEVVLVNAKGGLHTPIAPEYQSFRLTMVNDNGNRLLRPQAANAGLERCKGKYIGFLDDDDTIDPDHVEVLLRCLQKGEGHAACYSGVRCLNRDVPQVEQGAYFSESQVDFIKLLMGNILPIHAVLFPSEVLAQGICFDESLDLYEDWDFWLQIAEVLDFEFSGLTTATYYFGGDSQVGVGAAVDDPVATAAYSAVFNKWSNSLTSSVLKEISSRFYSVRDELFENKKQLEFVENCLRQSKIRMEAAEGRLEQADLKVTEYRQQLQTLVSSKSWKITSPLRIIATRLKIFLSRYSHYSR